MKKQVGRPPEKRQRLGPRKILRSKKDKKRVRGRGRGGKEGMPPTTNGSLPQGLRAGRMHGPYPAPAHKTGACISPPHGKDKKRTRKNKRRTLFRPQAPATTGGGSAVVRGPSCASCTPAKIIGQIPMFRSLPDGKLTKSDPHRLPDGNFYSAAPGMISDTARKKHSAR